LCNILCNVLCNVLCNELCNELCNYCVIYFVIYFVMYCVTYCVMHCVMYYVMYCVIYFVMYCVMWCVAIQEISLLLQGVLQNRRDIAMWGCWLFWWRDNCYIEKLFIDINKMNGNSVPNLFKIISAILPRCLNRHCCCT
jgi:hypothetical protein